MDIAFFDFDGTITKQDSFFGFLLFSAGPFRFALKSAALIPVIFRFLMKKMPNQEAKERVIAAFFGGTDAGDFNELSRRYAESRIPRMIREEAALALEWHRSRNDSIVVVSASPENWIAPWCEKMGFGLIATRLEVKEGRITGKFASKNCRGSEKVSRIKKQFDLSSFEKVYAYGNSGGDREMLEMADIGIYRWRKTL